MLPNDSSKLKTPELSSDMLNALADTCREAQGDITTLY